MAEADAEGDQAEVHRGLRAISRRARADVGALEVDGAAGWRDHFSRLGAEVGRLDGMRVLHALKVPQARIVAAAASFNRPLGREEVRRAIFGMRPGAGGLDEIRPEFLKALAKDAANFEDLFELVKSHHESAPELWGLPPGCTVPIPKVPPAQARLSKKTSGGGFHC